MLESLKKKTLLGNLWCIIVLGIVTATLGVLFGSGIVKMLAGPAYFEPLDDHEDILSLQGQYITMDVDTLIDYYAETVRSESGKRDEDEAQEILRQMQSTYPDAMIGYNAEIEKRYRANPVTFHQEVAAARRQPAAAPAAEPTEPAQEPESKPLY